METERIILGLTEEEVWKQIEADFAANPTMLQYQTVIEQNGKRVNLDIDVDLGGGFEGGFALTTFSAPLYHQLDPYTFAIHHHDFVDEIGKFFGMQDEVLGFDEFDRTTVVKTNDVQRTRAVFADKNVRSTLAELEYYTFYIDAREASKELMLEIEDGITDPRKLREIYHAFYLVLLEVY